MTPEIRALLQEIRDAFTHPGYVYLHARQAGRTTLVELTRHIDSLLAEPVKYETLPWVADFLNRRFSVVEEMKQAAKDGILPDAGQLRTWARRLEVPSEFS